MPRIILIITVIININSNLFSQLVDYETKGIENDLPVIYKKLQERQNFPLSWLNQKNIKFADWQKKAKNKVMECLQSIPPTVAFNPKVIDIQDRGTYLAKKIALNITADSRVVGYLLTPKITGTHPAVLLLHDHGGFFEIGKEKVVAPWNTTTAKIDTSKYWINQYYGNRYIGDELAKKGYVCFVVDMLNWGDRGGAEADGQQSLSSNLLNMGSSLAGLIAHEDIRAAEFLANQPEVDSKRIAAVGLSVGGFRTWQLAALSKHISAGISVCWITTLKGVITPGNNQTRGGSSYTMTHPGLSQFLDYPDVASIACPKPMYFISGNQDHLFNVPAIEEAYTKMRKVWKSQNAEDKIITKIYNSPHQFNLQMQNESFEWLDKVLKNNKN